MQCLECVQSYPMRLAEHDTNCQAFLAARDSASRALATGKRENEEAVDSDIERQLTCQKMTMRSVLQASENESADPVEEVVPIGSESEIQTPRSENIPELEAIPSIVSPPYSVEDADATNNFKRLLIRDHYDTSGAQRYIAPIMDKNHSPVIPSTATDTDKLLITSARSGNIEMMEMMLKLEPNIDADLAGEGTFLTAAVKSGKLEAVELLLNAGGGCECC